MKIIRQRERVESVSYTRSFEYEDMPGAGFGFDCDEHGNVNTATVPLDSWEACMRGEIEVIRGASHHWVNGELERVEGTGRRVVIKLIDMGAIEHRHSYVEPAVGVCACGALVELDRFTNTCGRCERDYNSSGQELAPREFWGEETGESVSDILMADVDVFGGE